MATNVAKRRRYPAGDSTAESEDETTERSNVNAQPISQRRNSFTNEFSSHRLIVSERRQLAVLKQLTASDEPGRRERDNEIVGLIDVFQVFHHHQTFHNVPQNSFVEMNMEKPLFILPHEKEILND